MFQMERLSTDLAGELDAARRYMLVNPILKVGLTAQITVLVHINSILIFILGGRMLGLHVHFTLQLSQVWAVGSQGRYTN